MKSEDSVQIVKYRIEKAKETIQEVDVLIGNNFFNTAINRLYYSCFYAVSALLKYSKLETHTHSGTRRLLGLHFVKTGKISEESGKTYSKLFNIRHTGDYDDFIEYSKDDVESMLSPAKALISKIENLLKNPDENSNYCP